MPAPASPTIADWITSALFVFLALWIYGLQVRRICRDGGKVVAAHFRLPELVLSILIVTVFATLTVAAIVAAHQPTHKSEPMNVNLVLPQSLFYLVIVVAISGFMQVQGLSLRVIFGLDRVSPLAVLGWACGLVLATFPFAFVSQQVTNLVFHHKLEPQPLVDLFAKVARQHDYSAMSKILISAVIVAPTCEEFLFRGFFYGVWKRYIGPLGAGLIACLLFAALHTSISAFAGLFLLAACLNIAYERTGSLLVPICMHALFNLTSLLVLYEQAQLTAGQ